MRSKGATVTLGDGNKMFTNAAEYATEQFNQGRLQEGWVYHGEYLQRPRHNTLEYDRVPFNHFMLFGVRMGVDSFVSSWDNLARIASDIHCEPVPLLYSGEVKYTGEELMEFIEKLMAKKSILGKVQPEGVVIKNYQEELLIGGMVIPILVGKYVSEAFKEKHKVDWKAHNPKDEVAVFDAFKSEPRWVKAVQARRDAGELLFAPQDIGPLLQIIQNDLFEEEGENIKNILMKMWKDRIRRRVVAGFPEWYKKELVKGTFDETRND